MEVDPATGEVRAKKVASDEPPRRPTEKELFRLQMENSIAEKSANLVEQNRKAEMGIIEKFKAKDPLFAQNITKAREKIMGLPATQRNDVVWERAYNMAMGETSSSGAYEKHWTEVGRQQALKEFSDAEGVSLPKGSGAGSGGRGKDGKVDVSKVRLTSEQRNAAAKLIQGGFINSLDEYKENAVLLGEVEVEA